MTVLFADLVGFTSRAEQLDPEDVRAVLEPYHARLRTELERRGGTVEKFIGDAVMALFGAPTAHEDDPERAVRAALAIRDWLGRRGRPAGANRRHHGRGARRARRAALRRRGHGLGRRREHRRPPAVRRARQRDPRRRDDLPVDAAADPVRAPRGGGGQGQVAADPGLGSAGSAVALRRRCHALERWASRRPRERARHPARHAPTGSAGGVAPARHARRRSRDRQEPPRLGALLSAG